MTSTNIDEARLADAMSAGELVFYYQPKASLLTGRMAGVEALLRWPQPDGSMIPPGHFIPEAEASGFITEISRAMFPRLVQDLMIIHAVREDVEIGFNLSAHDFEEGRLTGDIMAAIESHQIDPVRFQIELTEAAILASSETVRQNILSLVDRGVRLAMDDYGIGYSSIDTLSRWPFSVVKVDRGLIGRVLESEKIATIVMSSIRMAHELGMEVIAEGIESNQVFRFLQLSGCSGAQGFWLAQPMPLPELIAFLKQDVRWEGLPTGLIHMAQMDHIQWRKQLIDTVTTALYDPANAFKLGQRLELDHHECMLGRWYYGIGAGYRGIAAFDALERPHQELHAIGKRLLERCRNGADIVELVTLMRELTGLSSQALQLLQELESELLLQSHFGTPAAKSEAA